jgi:hypothetical protein
VIAILPFSPLLDTFTPGAVHSIREFITCQELHNVSLSTEVSFEPQSSTKRSKVARTHKKKKKVDEWGTIAKELDTFGHFGRETEARRVRRDIYKKLLALPHIRHAVATVAHREKKITKKMVRVGLATIIARQTLLIKEQRALDVDICASWIANKIPAADLPPVWRKLDIEFLKASLEQLLALYYGQIKEAAT